MIKIDNRIYILQWILIITGYIYTVTSHASSLQNLNIDVFNQDDISITRSSTSPQSISMNDVIPVELIGIHVASHLKVKNILRMAMVCKPWRTFIMAQQYPVLLCISGIILTPNYCQTLTRLPFTSLMLESCRFNKQQLDILSQSTHLKSLRIMGNGADALGNKEFFKNWHCQLSTLMTLRLHGNGLVDKDVADITQALPQLTSLMLSCQRLTDTSATYIATLTNLVDLNLDLNHISDSSVKNLALHLTNLTKLSMNSMKTCCHLTSQAVDSLSRYLTRLNNLDIGGNEAFNDDCCPNLERLTNLTELNISCTSIHIKLSQLRNLISDDLSDTELSNTDSDEDGII